MYPIAGKRVDKQVKCPAIERVGGHDLISGPGDIETAMVVAAEPEANANAAVPPSRARNPLFENIMGWIYYARVGIPEFGDRAECYRLLEILKTKEVVW